METITSADNLYTTTVKRIMRAERRAAARMGDTREKAAREFFAGVVVGCRRVLAAITDDPFWFNLFDNSVSGRNYLSIEETVSAIFALAQARTYTGENAARCGEMRAYEKALDLFGDAITEAQNNAMQKIACALCDSPADFSTLPCAVYQFAEERLDDLSRSLFAARSIMPAIRPRTYTFNYSMEWEDAD